MALEDSNIIAKGSNSKTTERNNPKTAKGNKPETAEGNKPETVERNKPETAEGNKPEIIEGGKSKIVEGSKLETTEGNEPEIAKGDKAILQERIVDAQGRAYATGRRKNAIAKVWLKAGSGKIEVNGIKEEAYFARPVLRMILRQPLVAAKRDGEFDVRAQVKGGGLSGQAGALRHAVSRALINYEPLLRAVLKPHGFLTRDSRVVERKKYGRAKARRSFQFSKR